MGKRVARRFPKEIDWFGTTISIEEGSLGGPLGYFDESALVLKIEADQPWAGKCIIFVHEVMHAIDALLIGNGLRKRRVDHSYIEYGSPALLGMLIQAGMFNMLTMEELRAFCSEASPRTAKASR